MKVVMAGGSGQVGTLLARAFLARGEEVVILTRGPGDLVGTIKTSCGCSSG